MKTMARANMDPQGAQEMFKIMQAAYKGSSPPEFLLTHPLTGSRIADASSRSREYPRKIYTENLQYQLMRARVKLSFAATPKKAVAEFRRDLAAGGPSAEASQYGLVLALMANGELKEARELLMPLRSYDKFNMTYGIAEAELLTAEGKFDEALTLLNRGMEMVPGNHPITMALANTQMKAGEYPKAVSILLNHSKSRRNDPNIWYQLAEAEGKAGNTLGVHQARAEYFLLHGQLGQAHQQLGFALKLPTINNVTRIRLQERIKRIEMIAKASKGF